MLVQITVNLCYNLVHNYRPFRLNSKILIKESSMLVLYTFEENHIADDDISFISGFVDINEPFELIEDVK